MLSADCILFDQAVLIAECRCSIADWWCSGRGIFNLGCKKESIDDDFILITGGFEGLSEQDQEEILRLIAFKKQMASRKKGELV